MNKREEFINYVKNGGKQFCSPQIGAGAGFDTRVAGKEWVSETTLSDTKKVVGKFDILPLITLGCPFENCIKGLEWKMVFEEKSAERRVADFILQTPKGNLTKRMVEEIRNCPMLIKYPVESEDDLEAFEYYLDAMLEADYSGVTKFTEDAVATIASESTLCLQWATQPYEHLCFPNTVDTVLLAQDCPERFKKNMNKIVQIDEKLMKAVAKGGADFIFLGGPGSEMLSPRYYNEYIIPYSKIVTDIAHENGLLVYSHICSPIEPFLSMGFYNKMGIDLFETLSPPPVGNVVSIRDALEKLDPKICTRGNVGLDVMLNGNKEEVMEKTYEVIKLTEGRKHIIAASDYLFYDIPEDNVHAMASCCAG